MKHSFRKMQTPNRGAVHLNFSFPLGAAEDGSFPSDYLVDGYIGTFTGDSPDGYGAVTKGPSRVDVGEYEFLLEQQFIKCISANASLECLAPTALFVQFFTPVHDTITGTDGKKRSRIRFRLVNGSGVLTDSADHRDRLHLSLVMDNSLSNP